MEEEAAAAAVPPIIDLGDFPNQLDGLRRACEDWGCFRVVNHGIPEELTSDMKRVVRSLFDLPRDVKERNRDIIAGSGYMAPSEKNPLYEALGLYDMGSSDSIHTFCSQLDANPDQRDTIVRYAKAIHDLVMEIAARTAECVGLRGDLFKEWPCQFRINKYCFTPQSVGSLGVQLHTDSGFLTILQEDENVGGLEVMDKTGSFVAIDPQPGTFLVNLGDMAAIWSNGKWCNVRHRVQCNSSAIRVSIATFLLGPKAEPLEAPSVFIDSESSKIYNPVEYEEYRKLRLSTKLQAGEALAFVQCQK
ncbi:hypothetical protein MLD38_015036 [Melastoma candidum]|uniref:Uncharacterized protein n=1 Tax=Melastoma candidum TaxID=119954 RepID=A0ACB9RFC8_9MYRT|nr:hypothetical protein MLD38_015036 [Melastoma candidum]